MATTVGIQLGRLQRKWGKIVSLKVEGRGLVYGFEGYLDTATLSNPVEHYPTDEEYIAMVAQA